MEELENFDFPPSKEIVSKTLEEGKFLILLDGLDEVPESNFNAVCNSIDGFVTKFEKNRFIASCRLAAYKTSFQRFRDIQLADFNDQQIEQFIYNWFQSDLDQQSDTASTCWSDLNQPGNKSAKELAQTPLLLTFLCLVYNRSLRFPSNRSELYQRALDILLEEWAAEKRVKYPPIAPELPELNVGLEKVLLSEIAYENFAADRLFFPRQQLIDSIKDFLADTVDKPKYLLDGQAILNAMVIQQGILVERAQNIFSFSHLTLQEYLTALYISKQRDGTKKLIKEHLEDKGWREVFLLVAGLVGTEELLELMEKEIQIRQFINTPKLKALLRWAEEATAGSEGDISSTGKRAIAIANANAYAYALANVNAYALAYALAYANANALAYAYANANANANANALVIVIANANANVLKKFIQLADELEKLQIFPLVNFPKLADNLQALEAEIPEDSASEEVRKEFVKLILKTWLKAFGLTLEMVTLSQEELKTLDNYFYANYLMVKCKEAAVRVSRKTWSKIEERMLRVEDALL